MGSVLSTRATMRWAWAEEEGGFWFETVGTYRITAWHNHEEHPGKQLPQQAGPLGRTDTAAAIACQMSPTQRRPHGQVHRASRTLRGCSHLHGGMQLQGGAVDVSQHTPCCAAANEQSPTESHACRAPHKCSVAHLAAESLAAAAPSVVLRGLPLAWLPLALSRAPAHTTAHGIGAVWWSAGVAASGACYSSQVCLPATNCPAFPRVSHLVQHFRRRLVGQALPHD